jgi:ABC-2 type transport system permease protein
MALIQALVFLLLAPATGIPLSLGKLAALGGILFLVGFGLTALGLLIAWSMDSTQGFHAIMNPLLVPMWLLSGSIFPASGAPALIRLIIRANPLTYGVAAVRRLLYLGVTHTASDLPSLAASILVMLAFSALLFGTTAWLATRPATR